MQVSIDRMQFLRGDFKGQNVPLRPPWAIEEHLFIEQCDRCHDCIPACPKRLINIGRGGYPEIDFTNGGCDFCSDCVTACKPAALNKRSPDSSPWNLKIEIHSSCLSLNGTTCRSCGEACDERAIRFQLKVGGIASPSVDKDLCTGCGQCIAVCPIKVVRIHPDEAHVVAA